LGYWIRADERSDERRSWETHKHFGQICKKNSEFALLFCCHQKTHAGSRDAFGSSNCFIFFCVEFHKFRPFLFQVRWVHGIAGLAGVLPGLHGSKAPRNLTRQLVTRFRDRSWTDLSPDVLNSFVESYRTAKQIEGHRTSFHESEDEDESEESGSDTEESGSESS
jgi:hypothetical protein